MGGGSSVPATRANQSSQRSPELNGKKSLHCPVTTSIVNSLTGDRWFLIVFAPPSYFGLVLAARNMVTRSLLVKEFTDAELVKEKEAQTISMSWNVFFKAIATDIANANNDGAVCTFTPSGSLNIAVKIQLAGAPAGNRRSPDVFRCDLMPVDAEPPNVFRYFIEPLAIFACKKRTDLIDRPDPAKERNFGHCEAAAITKLAAGAAAEATIARHLDKIEELKAQLVRLRAEKRLQVAKTVAAQFLLNGRPADSSALGVLSVAPEQYEDPLLQDHVVPRAAATLLCPPSPPLFPAPVDGFKDIAEAEGNFAAATASVSYENVADTALYIIQRFVPTHVLLQMKLHATDLHQLLCDVQRLYSASSLWTSARRVTLLLRALLNRLATMERLRLADGSMKEVTADGIVVLVLALLCVGLQRQKMTSDMCVAGNHFLASLYPEAPLANQAVAVLYSLAVKHRLAGHGAAFPALLPAVTSLLAAAEDQATNADAFIPAAEKTLRDLFAFCCGIHATLPSEQRAMWEAAEAQCSSARGSSAFYLGLASCPSVEPISDPSSMTAESSSPIAERVSVVAFR